MTIRQLLVSIHDRERGLPDFQRDFVWGATQELICSIASTYPAGSFVEIRNTGNLLKSREFEGAQAMTGDQPSQSLVAESWTKEWRICCVPIEPAVSDLTRADGTG